MEGNEGARPSDPRRRISNEGAPPADPEGRRRRGGPPWGRIVAALIGLLLLAILIPLACSALRGGNGPGGTGSTDGGTTGGGQARGQTQGQGGGSTAASGGTKSGGAPAGGGNGASGGTTGGEVAQGPSSRGAGGAGAPTASLDAGAGQSGNGTTVTVPRAEISGTSGWLAIHADDNGKPGEVLGHAPLKEGANADVVVRLDKPAPSGKLYAMIHADDPKDGRYTFPDGDPPVEANGQPVVKPIQYTITGEQAGNGNLPASGGPPLVPALLAGGMLLAVATGGAVLVGLRLGARRA